MLDLLVSFITFLLLLLLLPLLPLLLLLLLPLPLLLLLPLPLRLFLRLRLRLPLPSEGVAIRLHPRRSPLFQLRLLYRQCPQLLPLPRTRCQLLG